VLKHLAWLSNDAEVLSLPVKPGQNGIHSDTRGSVDQRSVRRNAKHSIVEEGVVLDIPGNRKYRTTQLKPGKIKLLS